MQETLTNILVDHVAAPFRRDIIAIEFRKSPSGVPDAVLTFTNPIAHASAPVASSDVIESVVLKSHEIKLRLRDPFVAAHAARLAEHGGFTVAAPHVAPRHMRVAFCDPNLNKALHVGHLRNIALGTAIAGLWRWAGATVSTQSVACDIGRNMAEALAGLRCAGWIDPDAVTGRLDRQLGELYARYVTTAAVDEGRGNAADRVIARELELHRDEADRILDSWRAQDPVVRTQWAKVVDRVLREQATTLARLGVAIDDIVLESTALPGQPALVERLTRAGLAQREPSGAVVLATGRADYAHCPLVRADGFPTEHLRALILWLDLAARPVGSTVHVMGDEWRTSTEVRLAMLDQLLETDFASRYAVVSHALVRFGSSTMKSSSGNVLLIDDVLDAVHERARSSGAAGASVDDRGVRAALLIPMLAAAPDQIIEVTEATFGRLQDNLGWQLAALARLAGDGALPLPDPRSLVERFLVLQFERFDVIARRAAIANDPLPIVRFCRHLLALEQRTPLTPTALQWRARLIDHGLTALGIAA